MDKAFVFTEEDRRGFTQMLAEWRQRRQNPDVRSVHGDTPQTAPEVYVVRSPNDDTGIPALNEHGTGTPSTRESWLGDDEPGNAVCQIYRVVTDGPSNWKMLKVTGLVKRIYNLTNIAVPPNVWVVVFRDKFGTWFADRTALAQQSYTSFSILNFGILAEDTLTLVHTLTLTPGTYFISVNYPVAVAYGFGTAPPYQSHVWIGRTWVLGTAQAVLPAFGGHHATEIYIDANSVPSNCNLYWTDTIIVTEPGTIELYFYYDYIGGAVPVVAGTGTLMLGGVGNIFKIVDGIAPYQIGSLNVGATPIAGGGAGGLLYNNGGILGEITGIRDVGGQPQFWTGLAWLGITQGSA